MQAFTPKSTLGSRLAGWLLLAVTGTGGAQAPAASPPVPVEPARAAQLVRAATREVLLCLPSLQSRALAEAVREAMRVRGVPVYILASPARARERSSYLTSLRLAGARVRLAETPHTFLVVDRAHLAAGRALGALDSAPARQPLRIGNDPRSIRRQVRWFAEAFRTATPFAPFEGRAGSGP